MSERIYWPLNRPYGFDEKFRFRYGEKGEKMLMPCEPIRDLGMCLGVIDGNNLKAKRLMLRDKDRERVLVTVPETGDTLEFSTPGKSAAIILYPNLCDRDFVKNHVINFLAGVPDRCDHMHVACVADILSAGWIPYWLPIQLDRAIGRAKLTHVRMVSERTINEGQDPTMEDAERLKAVFQKIC